MHVMEECAQCSLEITEVILADQQLEPDNRQVLIVKGIPPGDINLIADRGAMRRCFEREAG
jgi:hypothetical protein